MNKFAKLIIIIALPVVLLLVLAALSLQSASTPPAANQPGHIELQDNSAPTNIDGNAQIGKTDHYTLHVEAGQTLLAALTSPGQDVLFSIRGADGQVVWNETSLAFLGILPITQDYFIDVTSGRGASKYRLSLQSAPRPAERTATSLQPNLNSAPVRVEGHMKPGQIDSYTFDAASEQILYADIWNSFPGQQIQLQAMDLVINDAAGKALYGGSAFWMGELPATQKYSINLIPSEWPANAQQLDYALSLGIYTPSEAHQPTRIQLSPDQSVVTVTDKIEPMGKRWGRNRYLVSVSAGQKLNLKLTSENEGAFTASVRGADGKLLAADYALLTGRSNSPLEGYTLELPAAQDYTISIIGSEGSNYKMQVTLQP